MTSPIVSIISGYEVEAVPAESLRAGDIIYNPYSHTHLDNWTVVSAVKVNDTHIEIEGIQGGDKVSKDLLYKRRARLAHPKILATMFARGESLDKSQIEYLQKSGHLAHDDKGYLVLTPYAHSEIGGT
nr:hypothetical protein [uncultured Pseudoxanthomonas sp.]